MVYVGSTELTCTTPAGTAGTADVTVTNPDNTTTTTYNLGVNATFSDWEVAQMASGVTLSYRPAGSTGAYTDVALTQNGNSFNTTLTGLAGGQYELQLSYTDINGQTVIPSTTNANTIIINRADKLGLAQLHQIRGRVGRSHHRAYAYLLAPPQSAMTEDAKKRLAA